MAITPLPTPPTRSDAANFAARGDQFMGAWPTLVTQINETAAAMDAALQTSMLGVTATSSTSLAIGTGSKTLTVETGKGFVVGMSLKIASTASPTANYMIGTVTSYTSGTGALIVSVDTVGGSGTVADWTVSIATMSALKTIGGVSLQGPGDIALPGIDSIVVLTSGTSWTCPPGIVKLKLKMVGGGSAGTGYDSSAIKGGDGASAGYLEAVFDVVPGTTYIYAVAGGGSNASAAGGTSTFAANGITYYAYGGGASSTFHSGSGGTASGTGALCIDGISGTPSMSMTSVVTIIQGKIPSVLGNYGAGGMGGNSLRFVGGTAGIIILELYK